jgi:hypothetical protein
VNPSGQDDAGRSKPADDQMHAMQPGTEDLVGEIEMLAADEKAEDAEILRRLAVLAEQFSVDEVFAVMVRYDTPDLLG